MTHSCLLCGPSVGVRSIQAIPMPGPCGSPTKDTFPENEIGQPRDDKNGPRTLTRDLVRVRAHPAFAIFHSTTPRQRSGLRHRRYCDRYSSLDELIAAIAFLQERGRCTDHSREVLIRGCLDAFAASSPGSSARFESGHVEPKADEFASFKPASSTRSELREVSPPNSSFGGELVLGVPGGMIDPPIRHTGR